MNAAPVSRSEDLLTPARLVRGVTPARLVRGVTPARLVRGVTLVVPLFNEEENLRPLVEELDQVRPTLPCPMQVVLVDDGSTDNSWQRVEELVGPRPWLRALRFLGNQGQTAAMAAGIEVAEGELVAFMDCDLQNDPNDLAKLLEPVIAGRADVACGWRIKRQDPISKTIPSRVANILIRRFLGLNLHDLGCTQKVFRLAYLSDVQLCGEMHRFLPAYAQSQGARIVEVPVNHRARRFGSSSYGLDRIFKVLVDLLTVKLLNAYGAKPAYFFGKIGLFFAALGTSAFALVAYRVFILGRPQSTPMIFIMLLLYITSLLCFMSGLLAEINIRILHQVGGRNPFKIVRRVGFEPRTDDPE